MDTKYELTESAEALRLAHKHDIPVPSGLLALALASICEALVELQPYQGSLHDQAIVIAIAHEDAADVAHALTMAGEDAVGVELSGMLTRYGSILHTLHDQWEKQNEEG
jgi:hypothetical protein